MAPYKKIGDLPKQVKDNMNSDLQGVFLRVFNNAYQQYNSETRAFRTAWAVIRQIGRKNKKGTWIRKKKRENGKLVKVKLTRAMLEEILEKEEKETIDEVMKVQQLEVTKRKNELLNKLLNNKEKENK